ncbi:MAG: hypothetical protein A3J54_03560 [Candidatus Ryanbacteria bacterium RIFCSPHIGHO2_02_FULL_45_13b]|uniref:Uncharacterized protein n=1 Tax=Candidatus Ryanbacteria bacterium RIFCSPHIGHO2_02_FULL_45_13b TaxID=1802117 RepID=A0A1G2G4J7_9BACT|nr:MAG: hypothetical protein A3J54_03560 [Candidatus Ryanbacteria bacterium RIFCSPHIGHO2_02_FULL_45_13b]
MINKNFFIFIVVALLMLGIVYYFSALPEDQTGNESLSDDTSIDALEDELIATDLDNLDQEFADIEMELGAAISEAQ